MIPIAKGQGTLKQALSKSGPSEMKKYQVFLLLWIKIIRSIYSVL